MNAALMYCHNEFKKAHEMTRKNNAIYEAFEALIREINQLSYIDQINLYSVTTQFLESLVINQADSINPLDVFILRTNSIVDEKNNTARNAALALGVVAISLAVIITGGAIGIGIGMLMGLWQTPLIFMASLLAAETAPLIVASTASVASIGAGLLSGLLFFKEPRIKKSLTHCVEAIKQSHLSVLSQPSANEDNLEPNPQELLEDLDDNNVIFNESQAM